MLLLGEQGDKWIDDSVTPADGTPVLAYALTGAEDALALADNVTTEKGKGQNVNDSVTPSDALSFDRVLVIADSVTPSDAFAFDRASVLADSVTPSDNLASAAAFVRGVDDSVAPADGTPSVGYALSGSEPSLSLSDNVDPVKGGGATDWQQPVDDTLGLSDNVSTIDGNFAAVDDSVGVSDAQILDRGLGLDDTVGLSDGLTTLRGIQIDDTVGLADAQAKDQSRTVADNVGLADSEGHSLVTPADSVTPTDGTPSVGYALSGAENSLSISDNVTPVKNAGGTDWTRNIDDTVSVADSGAMFNFTVDIAETDFQITDNFARVSAIQRAISDSVTPSDNVDPQKTSGGPQIDDSVTTSDAVSFARVLVIEDTVGITDSAVAISTFSRSVADTVSLSDDVASTATFSRSIPDTLAIADATVTSASKQLDLADSVGLSDLAAAGSVTTRSIGDQVFISDVVERQKNGVVIVDPSTAVSQPLITIGRF